jgi:hypothetical protein
MATINDTIALLRGDVDLLLMLERLQTNVSRAKLQAKFCRAELEEKRKMVLLLLHLERMQLIDRDFRITDTGYYFLDELPGFR